MLQDRIIPCLADKYLLENTNFMQDCVPPNIARQVKGLLHKSFCDDRVLSRHFHYVLLLRFPDLNPCDYLFRVYLKSQVNNDRPIGMLKENILCQFLSIHRDMLYNAVHNILPWLQLLLRNGGRHVEH